MGVLPHQHWHCCLLLLLCGQRLDRTASDNERMVISKQCVATADDREKGQRVREYLRGEATTHLDLEDKNLPFQTWESFPLLYILVLLTLIAKK